MRTFVLAALLTVSSLPATAQQFTLGASTQSVVVTSDGTGIVDVQLGTCSGGVCTLSGSGLAPDGDAGTYTFTITEPTDFDDFGPNNGVGVFPLSTADGTAVKFSFTDTVNNDNNLSNIPVTLTSLNDGSANPHLAFTTSLGTTVDEVTFGSITCTGITTACNLDDVAAASAGATASAKISSGQIPFSAPVPEPASMALLGTALLGAYGLLRRKL